MQSIEDIIETIQIVKEKLKNDKPVEHYRKKWTLAEEELLCKLIAQFGSDFTILHSYFFCKSRKQIKKKYRQLVDSHQKTLIRLEKSRDECRRKSYFDEEILSDKNTDESLQSLQ